MDNDPETLLRRLHDRDAEIGVLLQRVHLLNRRAPPAASGVIDHGFGLRGGMGSYDVLKERLSVVCGCQEKVGGDVNVDSARYGHANNTEFGCALIPTCGYLSDVCTEDSPAWAIQSTSPPAYSWSRSESALHELLHCWCN